MGAAPSPELAVVGRGAGARMLSTQERSLASHELKTWPDSFAGIWAGDKKFDVRPDDRGFALGDVLLLREYEPGAARYTGRELTAKVTYVLQGGQFGIKEGYVVLGIERMQRASARLPRQGGD